MFGVEKALIQATVSNQTFFPAHTGHSFTRNSVREAPHYFILLVCLGLLVQTFPGSQ